MPAEKDFAEVAKRLVQFDAGRGCKKLEDAQKT